MSEVDLRRVAPGGALSLGGVVLVATQAHMFGLCHTGLGLFMSTIMPTVCGRVNALFIVGAITAVAGLPLLFSGLMKPPHLRTDSGGASRARTEGRDSLSREEEREAGFGDRATTGANVGPGTLPMSTPAPSAARAPAGLMGAQQPLAMGAIDWSQARSLLPQWGALLRREPQEAIPIFLGSPREGTGLLQEALRPEEALAFPVDALTIFGSLLAGLGRPFWAWILGALIGFTFGLVWLRAVAYGAQVALRSAGRTLAAADVMHLVSTPFLLPLFLAVADVILAPLTRSYGVALVLCFGSLIGTIPFTVGAFQARGVVGWRSVLLGVAATMAVVLPWLLLSFLFRRIQ